MVGMASSRLRGLDANDGVSRAPIEGRKGLRSLSQERQLGSSGDNSPGDAAGGRKDGTAHSIAFFRCSMIFRVYDD
ncbi:hypothetical protein ABZP36_006269 [Zizania latifolia]